MASSLTAVIILLFLASTAKAQPITKCDNDAAGNYTTNGTFITNLQSLLQALTSNATATGYADGSIPDRVYGLVLCRGDVDSNTCRSCLSTGSQDVLDRCPLSKVAAIWYEYCFLRYPNTRFASDVADAYKVMAFSTATVTSDRQRFNQSLMSLLSHARRYAACNTSVPPPRMFATGLIRFNEQYPNITALVQCTRDLTQDGCSNCLTSVMGVLRNGSLGGRYVALSCYIRYEVYRFYNETSRIYLPAISAEPSPGPAQQSPSPPPLAPTTPSTNSNNTTTGRKA